MRLGSERRHVVFERYGSEPGACLDIAWADHRLETVPQGRFALREILLLYTLSQAFQPVQLCAGRARDIGERKFSAEQGEINQNRGEQRAHEREADTR